MPSTLLPALRAVGLKGRTTPPDVAAAVQTDEAAATATLTELVDAGHAVEANGRYRLSPAGKEQLAAWLAEETAGIDGAALTALYEDFDPHNTRLKELASAWQMRDGDINDHSDATYDQGVLDGVAVLHEQFAPLVDQFIALAPRLAPYGPRLDAAIAKIQAGEHTYFLRPIIDSYHTVWFELHEDLISMLGRNRTDEALAGRAE